MQKKLAIYGSGGLGIEMFDIALRINGLAQKWNEIVFINDFEEERAFLNTKILHFETIAQSPKLYECIVAVGEPTAREMLYRKLKDVRISLATLLDPTAIISPSSQIGEGTIVCEFSTIHADVVLGENCLVQPYACIGHNISVGKHSVFSSFCAPGGNSVFGNCVYCGMQSSIKEGLTVGDNAIIAMAAAVFCNVPAGAVFVGNPARITRGNDQSKVFSAKCLHPCEVS